MRSLTVTCALLVASTAGAWTLAPAQGGCRIEQRDDRCEVRATEAGGRTLWTSFECLARDRQLRFTDASCVHLLVLEPLPAAAARAFEVRVGAMYRRGVPVRELRLREFGALAARQGDRLDWIVGAGFVGRGATEVTVEARGGARVRVPWSGAKVVRVVPGSPRVQAPCGRGRPCSSTDERGMLHVEAPAWRGGGVPPAAKSTVAPDAER